MSPPFFLLLSLTGLLLSAEVQGEDGGALRRFALNTIQSSSTEDPGPPLLSSSHKSLHANNNSTASPCSFSLSVSSVELTFVTPCIILLVWLLFLLPPGERESTPFLLFDFSASREALPRAFFIFLHSTDISSERGLECVDCSVSLCIS